MNKLLLLIRKMDFKRAEPTCYITSFSGLQNGAYYALCALCTPDSRLCQTLPTDKNDESNINHSIKRMLSTVNQMFTKFRQCGLM